MQSKEVEHEGKEGETLSDFPHYIIFRDGTIYSKPKGDFLVPTKRNGYLHVRMLKGKEKKKRPSLQVHRLVALAFIPNPDCLPKVNHKDGVKTNNCVENLEWITSRGNSKHAHDTGLIKKRKKVVLQCDEKGNVLERFESIREAEEKMKCYHDSVGRVCRGKAKTLGGYYWKFETEEQPHQDEDQEIWKEIGSYSDHKFSSFGRIFGKKYCRCLKPHLREDGYLRVKISGASQYVHILISEAFLGPRPSDETRVNHKDGNKANNTIENLEYITQPQNVQHAYDNGLNTTAKPVVQYSLKGKEIAKFRSSEEAKRSMKDKGKKTGGGILKVCERIPNYNTAYGYIWRYKDDPLTKEEIAEFKHFKRAVDQYTVEGELVESFSSLSSAAEKVGVHSASIIQALKGKSSVCAGFVWKDSGEKFVPPKKTKRKVQQLTLKGKVMKTFSGVCEASRETGVSQPHISDVCSGKRKSAGGFLWSFY